MSNRAAKLQLGNTLTVNISKNSSPNYFKSPDQNPGVYCIYVKNVGPATPINNSPPILVWQTFSPSPVDADNPVPETGASSKNWTVDFSMTWIVNTVFSSDMSAITTGSTGTIKGIADPKKPAYKTLGGDRYKLTKTNGAYGFSSKPVVTNTDATASVNTIGVNCDKTVQNNECSVGIALYGTLVTTIPAQPNYYITFTPLPEYYITFGPYTTGKTIDNVSWSANAFKLDFSSSTTISLSLGPDNTFSVDDDAAQQ